MYLFPGPNGQVHEFRIVRAKPAPTLAPKVEQTELLNEVLNILTELLTPQQELPKPEPIESERFENQEPETTMAHAFRNFKK
jgi:hypothetical protein